MSSPTQSPPPDYLTLRSQGIELVQRLAGSIWTDYNEHDPGVTILEQVCYALTELSYRAGLPMVDLLAGERGAIDTRRQALFPAIDIFPCNPLTQNDYRRIIVDRVPRVANVWLEPVRPTSVVSVNGLYDVTLYVPGADPCACEDPVGADEVREQVLRVYAHHRNLCEDAHAVRVLEHLRAVVGAVITIDEDSVPESVLAEVLFRVGRYLAPEIRRDPLDSLLSRGLSPDQIFEGPLLHHGFIGDDQLAPRAAEISVLQVARTLACAPGVLGVAEVSVRLGDAGIVWGPDASLPVPDDGIAVLDARPTRGGDFSIRVVRRGVQCRLEPTRVRRELERRWASHRRTYPLQPGYEQNFAVPRSVRQDLQNLSQYSSIQNQFPIVYGVTAYGPPDGADARRRGQVKQLKGYLLVFEQLLADFFAQLGRARDLFSTDAALSRTYFCQSLAPFVPDVRELLGADYERELARALRAIDPVEVRRGRFLDLLLALHGDHLSASDIASARAEDSADVGVGHQIPAKIALLESLVVSSRDRGRAFDYMAAPSPGNVAGMEVRSRIQLGIDPAGHRPLIEMLEEVGLELVADEAGSDRLLIGHAAVIDEGFEPVTFRSEDGPDPNSIGPLHAVLRTSVVTDGFLRAAANVGSYRVGTLPGDADVALVCRSPDDPDFRLLGRYPDAAAAASAARAAAGPMRALSRRCRQLYLVEHTLLRVTPAEEGPAEADEPFSYSFTVTAVLSHSSGREMDTHFEELARSVLRKNAPAHVLLAFCFLRPWQMRHFERLYRAWQGALGRRQPGAIADASAHLRAFLLRRGTSG